MICKGSDGSGYPVDGARSCSVCSVVFFDVGVIPEHRDRESEGEYWDAILEAWAQ